MAEQTVDIMTLMRALDESLVVDVRSPSEHAHGCIPGALGLPLFTDAQRAEIGTLYKQKGREHAMLQALDYYSPNMKNVIVALTAERRKSFSQTGKDKQVVVHCWRGGMRSGVACWMLELFGFDVQKLSGGYKSYRRWSLAQLENTYPFAIVGGRTGAAKTETLQRLKQLGEAAVDLEALAKHKGSAFGGIHQTAYPTQEQFENELSLELYRARNADFIWLEDESQRIGMLSLPNSTWKQMRETKVYYLDVPFEARLQHLVEIYGTLPVNALVEATVRIRKKLGGLQMQEVIDRLDRKNFTDAFAILLKYYDKVYDQVTAKRRPESIVVITSDTTDPTHNAKLILQAVNA